MTLLLRRFRPDPPLVLRRIGPDARLEALPATPAPAPAAVAVAIGPAGVAGPPGVPGPVGQPQRIDFVATATWTAAHNLGRVPMAIAYLATGERILADLVLTTINLTVTHAQPQTGFVLLI